MSRIEYFKVKPEMINRLRAITQEQKEFSIDGRLRALVELRVSQISGCVFCTDLHAREALELGESPQRLNTLVVWRESPFFDEREKAALAWAESLTLISETHAGETEYQTILKFFTDQEVVELSLAISLANFWNRMAGGFRRMPATP
jgi:alkylhydroperoxidase AhpD family core domain